MQPSAPLRGQPSRRLYTKTPFVHKNRVLHAYGTSAFRNFAWLDSALNVSVGIIAAVMICVAASQASEVFAPLALALFIIALVWPLQSWLQARMPALLALAITMTVTVAVCIAFASLAAWGFGRVGVS